MNQTPENEDGVVLVNPDNKLMTVPDTEVDKALGLGWRNATKDDFVVDDYVKENRNLKGSVKVGLNQLVNQLLFNVPETIQDYSDTDLEKAKRQALKKDHDIINIGGGVVGTGLSMLYGGPLAGAATGAVGKLVANRLGNAAIDAGVNIGERTLTKTGMGLATSIAKAGTEGVLMAAPQAATEAYFKDYDQAAESLLAGGLIGGAIGGGLNLASKGLNVAAATTKWAGEKLGIRPTDNQLAKAATEQATSNSLIEDAIKNAPAKDAKEISEALEYLKVKEEPWMISGNKTEKGLVSSLAQSPSIPGSKISDEINSIIDAAKNDVESTLSDKTAKTLKESGDEAQKLFTGDLLKREESYKQKYKWIDDNVSEAAFDEGVKSDIINGIKEDPHFKVNPGGIRQKVIDIVDRIDSFGTAKAARQEISGLVSNNISRGDLAVISDINQTLKNKMGDALDKLPETYPLKAEAKKNWLGADAEYKDTMDKYAPIDIALGGKRSKSVGAIIDKIQEGVETSKFTEKLFNTSEISRLQTIKRDFPDVFEVLKSQKMADIYSKSMAQQHLNVKNYFKQVDGIPKEIQKMMFGDDYSKRLGALKTVIYKALPEHIGPSGTPRGIDFQHILDVGLQLRDVSRYALLKSGKVHELNTALPFIEKSLKNVAHKLDQVDDALIGKEIYKGPTGTQTITSGLSRLLHGHDNNEDHKANFQKISDKLSELNLNPTANQATIAFSSALSNNGAPQISGIYQQQMQKALRYLYEMMPKDPNPPSVIKQQWHPNDAQMAKFNRIAKTVENPFSIMEDFQKGRLTKEQVDAFSVVFPKIYNQVKNRVINHAASNDLTKLPYNKKIQLGILLGNRDIDHSLNKLANYQANFNTSEAHNNGSAGMPAPKNYKFTQSEDTASEVNRIMNRH